MKALQLLGLNHRLRFEVPEGGALVVVRHPQRRVHLHFDCDNGGQFEMDCGTACGIDRTSSDVFPLPIEVYDMDEAALGMHCVANTDHGAIKSMIDTLQGLGVEAKREAIEPSLVRSILHGLSEAAQAMRPEIVKAAIEQAGGIAWRKHEMAMIAKRKVRT